MKRVSAKEFFTVVWRGLCQALGWFFGLFGYKRDGKFAKCVWGLFATSTAVIVTIIAVALVCVTYDDFKQWYDHRFHECDDEYCCENLCISRDIYYHSREKCKGYVYNIRTGEKYVKHVEWISMPLGDDSLVCFSDGKKRGYFSKNTGKVVIEPKYDHAWVFSEGIASVDEGGFIKFIDVSGNMVIDKKMPYIQNMEGYVFHGPYCVVDTDDGEYCGLMDKTGNIVLPMEYDVINPANDFKLWRLTKGDEMAVIDRELNTVMPMDDYYIYINDGTIDVTMPDHTIRKYDLEGNMIYDFCISSTRLLEYEKDDVIYIRKKCDDEEEEEYWEEAEEYYHPRATARLRAYVAADLYEGLMTADGHIVTMPLYKDIEAIGEDTYLCTSTNYDRVVVNGKGEIVK